MENKEIQLKKQQITRIKDKLNDLIILEKLKHCYFLVACFKSKTFKNTTEQTRKRYLLKYLSLTNGNYILIKQFNKDNTREHYNIIVNSDYKTLLDKVFFRFTDTIGTINKTYIESKNKKMENILFYLNKLLGKSYKTIIKENKPINEVIYNKSHETDLIKTTQELRQLKKQFIYLKINDSEKEQLRLKIKDLIYKENNLIIQYENEIKLINKKITNFKGFKKSKETEELRIILNTQKRIKREIKNNIYTKEFKGYEITEKKQELKELDNQLKKLSNFKGA